MKTRPEKISKILHYSKVMRETEKNDLKTAINKQEAAKFKGVFYTNILN